MHTRKRIMFDRADAFVALPGGVGTLEELVEQMTWAQLGQHNKPILMANVAGFWKPLLVLLAHMREAGFIRQELEVNYLVAEKIADIIPMLRAGTTLSALEPVTARADRAAFLERIQRSRARACRRSPQARKDDRHVPAAFPTLLTASRVRASERLAPSFRLLERSSRFRRALRARPERDRSRSAHRAGGSGRTLDGTVVSTLPRLLLALVLVVVVPS